MNIPSDVYFVGVCASVPAILLLLAGAGFRQLALGIAIVLAISIGGTLVGGAVGFAYGMATKGSGMFSGLEALFWMVVIGGISFVVSLIGALFLFARSGRLALDRSPTSIPYLVVGFAILPFMILYAFVQIIQATPKFQSNSQLVRNFGQFGHDDEWRAELIRRGETARSAIIDELHGVPQNAYSDKLDGVLPLLDVLWEIGGPESLAEIKRWTAATVVLRVRVQTIGLLAAHCDPSVLPLAVEILKDTSGAQWATFRTELFTVLGKFKAHEHAGLIRTALLGDTAQGIASDYDAVKAGIKALTLMDSDEAWSVIGELITSKNDSIRSSAVNALLDCKGPRVLPLLAKSLDNPDAAIREETYGALLRYEPTLLDPETSTEWNEQNLARLREALKKRATSPDM